MSVLIGDRASTTHHLSMKCPCGRSLRARPEQAGTEIQCWACHASVRVPVPVAPGAWVARLLKMAARQVLDARICTLMLIGALLVTMALVVPGRGVLGAALALGLVMTGYGELLRRGSQGDWTPRPAVGPLARVWRTLLCLGAGVALVLPLVFASGTKTAPRVTIAGLSIAVCLVSTLPILLLATYGLTGSIATRARGVGAMLARHPVAVLASLAILPLALAAIEGVMFTVARLAGCFAFLVLDLFPKLPYVQSVYGIPYVGKVDYRSLFDPTLLDVYVAAVSRGHTLIGAIPASLALDTSNGYATYAIDSTPSRYFQLRIFFTLLIVTGMLAGLAVQARWLGLLATVDSRRTAA